MSPGPIAFVVNGRAGRGGKSHLEQLPELLAAMDIDHRIFATTGPGDAIRLAREAAAQGFETVVAVGGDGTVNEVANGLMAAGSDAKDRPRLGVVAAGSGCDFARSFDLPKRFDGTLRGVVGSTVPLDVGRIECRRGGEATPRHFVNIAEAGMAAATAKLAMRLPRWVGRSRYLIAFWPTLLTYRPTEMTVTVGNESFSGSAKNVLVANCRYFGGGMHISPHSRPDDGVFEVQANIGPKRQAVTLIPSIYRGAHLPDERIIQFSGTEITIDSSTPVPVEADGEPLGTTPVVISVVRHALRLVV